MPDCLIRMWWYGFEMICLMKCWAQLNMAPISEMCGRGYPIIPVCLECALYYMQCHNLASFGLANIAGTPTGGDDCWINPFDSLVSMYALRFSNSTCERMSIGPYCRFKPVCRVFTLDFDWCGGNICAICLLNTSTYTLSVAGHWPPLLECTEYVPVLIYYPPFPTWNLGCRMIFQNQILRAADHIVYAGTSDNWQVKQHPNKRQWVTSSDSSIPERGSLSVPKSTADICSLLLW